MIFLSLAIYLNLILTSVSLIQTIIRSYFTFLIASLIAVSWISLSGFSSGADHFLILGGIFVLLVYPLFFVIPSVIFYFIKNKIGRSGLAASLLAFPFIWTASEYYLSIGQISFPWLFAGNSQSYNLSKIQFAEITGVFGISFWICLISIAVYFFFFQIKIKRHRLLSVKSAVMVFIIIFVYLIPDVYNLLSKSEIKYSGNKSYEKFKTGIIQPNTDPWKKWGRNQSDLIKSYTEDINNLYASNPDVKLIILPETALPFYFRESIYEENYMLLKNLCDSLNVPLLVGTPDLYYYEDDNSSPPDAKIMKLSGRKYDTFNSAFLFEPGKDKNEFQKHNKIKLVIGSERMPYQELIPFTKNLVEWGVGLSSWQIGKDTNLFTLNENIKFNTAICYESVYPEFFSAFVKKGADFSVVITNDGWWGKLFGTYQHNRFAVFRAVENRRWIARCANTGISCFIDAFGNFYDETGINEKKYLVYDIGLNKELTFYTVHGDVFSRMCGIITLIFFAAGFFLRKSNPTDHRH